MRKYSSVAMVMVGAFHFCAFAGAKELPLRSEAVSIYESSTTQAIDTNYGSSRVGLTFSNTTTYNFYSPPLASPCTLTSNDKTGGKVFVQNLSASHVNDFTVTAQLQFFDYDPATGSQTLIADTGASHSKDVSAGQIDNLPVPKVAMGIDKTIPAGHSLHVTVMLALVSGNPSGFGRLLYNGPRDHSSAVSLGEETSFLWNFVIPSQAIQPGNSIQMLGDGSAKITCSGSPNQPCLIQATPSLSSPSWTTIATNTAGADGLCVFVDTTAPQFPARFYRTAAH